MWKISGPCASLGTMQSAPVHKPGPTNWQILTSPRGASMMFAVRGKWVRINLPAKVQRSRMSAASFAPVMFLVTTFKPLFQAISTAGPCKVVAIRQTHQMMMNIGSGLQVASIASGARAHPGLDQGSCQQADFQFPLDNSYPNLYCSGFKACQGARLTLTGSGTCANINCTLDGVNKNADLPCKGLEVELIGDAKCFAGGDAISTTNFPTPPGNNNQDPVCELTEPCSNAEL